MRTSGLGERYGRRDDGRVAEPLEIDEAPDGVDVLGAEVSYTDPATVLAVQKAILAHPAYGKDAGLNLGAGGADGKWGPTTARAVARLNAWYTPGASASDNDGPHITDKTLAVLKLSPGGKSTSGGVGEWLSSVWSKIASSGAAGAGAAAVEQAKAASQVQTSPTYVPPAATSPAGTPTSSQALVPAPVEELSVYQKFLDAPVWVKVLLGVGVAGVGFGVYKTVRK